MDIFQHKCIAAHTHRAEIDFDKKEGHYEETEGVGPNAYQKGMGDEGSGISSCNRPEWHPNQQRQPKYIKVDWSLRS